MIYRIEESILIIKPRAAEKHCKDICATLLDENFYVTDFAEGNASSKYFENLWQKRLGWLPYFKELCQELASGTFLVLKVFRVNAITELIKFCGPDDPAKAHQQNRNSLRALFGLSLVQNAVYPAQNKQEVAKFNRDFFRRSGVHLPQLSVQLPQNTNMISNNNNHDIQQSLVVIKPNAAQVYGDVIRAHLIGQGFEIIQQKVFNLNSFVYGNMIYDAPDEFIDDIVKYMASGAVIALIVQKVVFLYIYLFFFRNMDTNGHPCTHKHTPIYRKMYIQNCDVLLVIEIQILQHETTQKVYEQIMEKIS